MPEHVRVGVVGTSWWSDLFHLPLLTSHPRAEVVAICGRHRERADEMARKYGIPSVFTDYEAMIEQGGLQALVVATPDDTHHPIVMRALHAGLHVLCEKPLALTARQAREMYNAAAGAGVKHMVVFTNRWLPHYRFVRQLVDEGYVGRCFHCHIRYEGGYGRDAEYGWRFDATRGNGILGDLGSHAIDLARWLVGDVARVSAHLASYVDRPGPEGQPLDPANDSAALTLEFTNGAQGTIHVSAVAHIGERGQEQQLILHGEGGTLEVDATFSDVEVRGARTGEECIGVLPIPDALRGDVDRASPEVDQALEQFGKESLADRAFVDAIVEDRLVSPDFYDALKVQEVIEAAVESHRAGRWVALR